MDKKSAEEDAAKKAKNVQAAAGKSSGMSGRDLVRLSSSRFHCMNVMSYALGIVHIQPGVVCRRRRGIG